MHKYVTITLSSLFLLAVIGFSIFAVTKWSGNNEASSKKSPVDVDLQSATAKSNDSSLQQESEQGQSLQVQGAQSQNKSPQLPNPDGFEVYEQFAQENSARYIDTKVGSGTAAMQGDTASLVYKGWLTNGTLFDQTQKNEQGQLVAFSFQIGAGSVIPGWDQGIVGMKVGGKRRLIIPPSQGYGENGQGPIPANAMLIFDVELVNVQVAEQSQTLLP